MRYLILTIAMIVTGCGVDSNLKFEQNPALFGDLDSIRESYPEAPLYYTESIYFEDQDYFKQLGKSSNVIGVCLRYSNGFRSIVIREDSWYVFSVEFQEGLLAHEAGHCDFNLDHSDGLDLMNPFINYSVAAIQKYGLRGAFERALNKADNVSLKLSHDHEDDHNDCILEL